MPFPHYFCYTPLHCVAARTMRIDEKRLLETFLELVRIDGPSKKERDVADYVKGCLADIVDEVIEDDAGPRIGGNAGIVVARIHGADQASSLIFATHLDTISSTRGVAPGIVDGYIKSGGRTILGADDRAAIAAVIEFARCLKEGGGKTVSLELLFTVGEELGLRGIKAMDRRLLRGRLAYVLDSEQLPGTIVNRGPFGEKLDIRVKGRSAHAGAEPEKGISAIAIASRAIAKMKLGRVSEEVRANIGLISGGIATNIVPPSVTVQGEARGYSQEELMEQVEHMWRCFEEEALAVGAEVDFKNSRDYDGFFIGEESDLFAKAASAAEGAGLKVAAGSSCGASDANVLNFWGIEALTLGTGFERAHSHEERIAVSSLVGCCRWIAGIALNA